ncbi:MAG: type IV secretion protein Rhs, partial [Gammaproteobacteria bacterium]|nr:type IV secretion protein Rhs [Gammaproteobacteria bacterium]
DPVGNRLSSTEESKYTYDNNNQLLAVGDTSYTYDENGNTIRQTTGDAITNFQYNLDNRLSQVKKNGIEASYYYDPFGRRLAKEVNGQRTWFYYSGEGLVAEFDDSGGLVTSYAWKPGSLWSTDPLILSRSGKHYFYHNDHLGAPHKLTDTKGAIVWQAEYDAFGEIEIVDAQIVNNLRFPGQYFDQETGLYYNWHRFYEPGT